MTVHSLPLHNSFRDYSTTLSNNGNPDYSTSPPAAYITQTSLGSAEETGIRPEDLKEEGMHEQDGMFSSQPLEMQINNLEVKVTGQPPRVLKDSSKVKVKGQPSEILLDSPVVKVKGHLPEILMDSSPEGFLDVDKDINWCKPCQGSKPGQNKLFIIPLALLGQPLE